jgi:uncharacterized protein (DUF885 family)
MTRRAALAASLAASIAAAVAPGCRHPAPPTANENASASPGAPGAARALAIADAIVDESLARRPAALARLRPPGARHDALPDDSLAAEARRDARDDAWLAELRAIDASAFAGSNAGIAYSLARSLLEARAAQRVCHTELWSVSQVGPAWHVDFADAALAQPLETPELRAQALARWAQLPRYASDDIAALREGLARGYAAPRLVVDHVLAQLDTLLAAADAEFPYASPAFRSDDAAFRDEFLALVERDVRPALRSYQVFLRDEYAASARATIAVSDSPGGRPCYEAALLGYTTLPISPEEVHERGLAALEEIEREMAAISARSFNARPVRELLEAIRSDPRYAYRDQAHLMAVGQQAMERAWHALPRAFSRIPRSRAQLEPIPAFQARTSAAHYLQAALDGSRPATYRVRTHEPQRQSWATGESVAFHEVVPGHHLQIALANEDERLPRIARLLFRSGFSEGWALYAERVADELGLYSSDADRLGMLNARAFRAVRMVVDTGMHALGWSRERAIAFMREHTALPESQIAQEIDRYIARPAQATAYLLGYQEISALRREAEARLGERFDLRAFHDVVLGSGSATLPVLRERVAAWMRDEQRETALAPRVEARANGATRCEEAEVLAYQASLQGAAEQEWSPPPLLSHGGDVTARVAFDRAGLRVLAAPDHSDPRVVASLKRTLARAADSEPPACWRGREGEVVFHVAWQADPRAEPADALPTPPSVNDEAGIGPDSAAPEER